MRESRLGVVVGMAWEAASLERFRRTPTLAWRVCGPGPERAERAARRLIEEGVDALVSWGTAAGLDPRLRPGSLLVPALVRGDDGERLCPSATWRAAFLARVAEAFPGELVETPRVLRGAFERQALRRASGAVAADMESAAVLRVARRHGIPALVVRVVLDTPSTGLPAEWAATMTPRGRVAVHRVAWQLLRPHQWAVALMLARARRRAADRLANTAAHGFPALLDDEALRP